LTYASLVADGNHVTVFEKHERPGGAFRHAGKAPLFQEVEASETSFERYIADLHQACMAKGVIFRFATDVTTQRNLLAPFDRIVIASGARVRRKRWKSYIYVAAASMFTRRRSLHAYASYRKARSSPRSARLIRRPLSLLLCRNG
jgi:hypothetical protein